MVASMAIMNIAAITAASTYGRWVVFAIIRFPWERAPNNAHAKSNVHRPEGENMDVSAETPLVAPGADQKRVTARRISDNYLAAPSLRAQRSHPAVGPRRGPSCTAAPAVKSERTPGNDARSTVAVKMRG